MENSPTRGMASPVFVLICKGFFFFGFFLASGNCEKQKKPLRISIKIEAKQAQRPLIQIPFSLKEEQRDRLLSDKGRLRQKEGPNFIRLYRTSDPQKRHYLGIYRLKGGLLVYQPAFSLDYDTHYIIEARDSLGRIYKKPYHIARPQYGAFRVRDIFPKPRKLPENMLYFHISFTNPIAPKQGIFNKIHLLDARGKRLKEVWKKTEIYYEEGHGLSLLLHPGRVKRGMLARKVLGPIFREGQSYRLLISAKVRNIYGKPLGRALHKDFIIGPPDYKFVQPRWSIQFPRKAKTKQNLILTFRESLDHASILKGVKILDEEEKEVVGNWRLHKKNKESYRFEPREKWAKKQYSILFTSLLTDLAGNSLNRLFEIIKNNKGEVRKGVRKDIGLGIKESWEIR